MDYNFKAIEQKWQSYWRKNKTYKVEIDSSRPKYYVLDMFPYPSGAGLHVGHPLGYIASDIYARFKRLDGFNVLHPMGYDAYGLPAEQYAIQTGQHPAITTEENLKRYREQLDQIGFSFDWSREVKTSDPSYYKWTQWAFTQMFQHYYDLSAQQAKPIVELVKEFEKYGSSRIENEISASLPLKFSAEAWNAMQEKEQQTTLLNYRLAYLADTMVNWCPALGTVLANDEVINGLSERGGHLVEQKIMRQWCLRVSAYSQRLLDGLNKLDWSHSLKEIQRNWIGRSEGAEIKFPVVGSSSSVTAIDVFTTRADTVFGVTFMVLAPESELVDALTTPAQRSTVNAYLKHTKLRTERERQAEVKKVTGVFSGSYALNPLTHEQIPIWIADYVLAGYGTGAVMAVPAHDKRDFAFAKQFELPIIQVVVLEGEEITDPKTWNDAKDAKTGKIINSGFLSGLSVYDAIAKAKAFIEEKKLGQVKINYRLRDAIFSRQRYWGEPFPVYYKEGMPYVLDESNLPLELPEVDNYKPTANGEPPLGNAKHWHTAEGYPLELNTMPGFAGSSAYYLRYMDPHNTQALVSKEANTYWKNVDLYIGGKEHATGHLIYSRFWNMFLYDLGLVVKDEPFQKLINQGMIQGRSNFAYKVKDSNTWVSYGLKDQYEVQEIHLDVNIVHNDKLDMEAFKAWRPEYKQAHFLLEDGEYMCGWAVEKMSKSLYNVVNPDYIIEQFGADTLRLYEMFLGPLEQSKPWDTNGIEGISRFLKKVWGLFFDQDQCRISDENPTSSELKILHTAIRKIRTDIEHFSFNTAVSAFMICANELASIKCNKRAILESFTILLAPFAPHVAEELWSLLGHNTSICEAKWPAFNAEYLVEASVEYPISFNGKLRFKIELPTQMNKLEIELLVLAHEKTIKWLEGATPKKVIVVPGKIVNIVI